MYDNLYLEQLSDSSVLCAELNDGVSISDVKDSEDREDLFKSHVVVNASLVRVLNVMDKFLIDSSADSYKAASFVYYLGQHLTIASEDV